MGSGGAGRLRHSDLGADGIRRRRCGRGFRYLGPDGPVTDPLTLDRIRALVIPPAWRDVWICADPRGHIQAVGTDAAGRRQYRYHDRWRAQRDRPSTTGRWNSRPRCRDCARWWTGMEQAVAQDKVCAVVGSLKQRRSGGEKLLAYRSGRAWHDVTAADINDYIREASGGEFTAKDFRTWHATVLAAVGLAVSERAASDSARKRAIARVVREVAGYLGNTPAVARASYIDPRVISRYTEGHTIAMVLGDLGADSDFGDLATRGRAERAVLKLLADRA